MLPGSQQLPPLHEDSVDYSSMLETIDGEDDDDDDNDGESSSLAAGTPFNSRLGTLLAGCRQLLKGGLLFRFTLSVYILVSALSVISSQRLPFSILYIPPLANSFLVIHFRVQHNIGH